jgi:hypothetical protein
MKIEFGNFVAECADTHDKIVLTVPPLTNSSQSSIQVNVYLWATDIYGVCIKVTLSMMYDPVYQMYYIEPPRPLKWGTPFYISMYQVKVLSGWDYTAVWQWQKGVVN